MSKGSFLMSSRWLKGEILAELGGGPNSPNNCLQNNAKLTPIELNIKHVVCSPRIINVRLVGRPRVQQHRVKLSYLCRSSPTFEESHSPPDPDGPNSARPYSAESGGKSATSGIIGQNEKSDSETKSSPAQESSPRPLQTAGPGSANNAALAALRRAKAYKASKTQSSAPAGNQNNASSPGPTDPPLPPVQTPDSPLQESEVPARSETGPGSGSEVSLASLMPSDVLQKQESELLAALASASCRPNEQTSDSNPTSDIDSPRLPEKPDQLEVQIITRDGIITRKVDPQSRQSGPTRLYKGKGISSSDFLGLGFEDKKDPRATPAGLRAPMDMPRGNLPAVEILTREANSTSHPEDTPEGSDSFYKPKVSTWGVFPRPRDISSTYGGGRTIRPGESLETAEEKAMREAKTRQLLENYRKISGLDMDAETAARCQQCLTRGGELMDGGRVREALEEFDVVIAGTVFQNPSHGRAMLQKAVCLDSMARSGDAKEMYEKLSTHPDVSIRKKARQMLFGFQAAENLRFSGGLDMDTSLYRPYFDAFADGYNSSYKASEEEKKNTNLMMEALPYALFLVLPLLLGLVAATF